jgi:hypothetical protein
LSPHISGLSEGISHSNQVTNTDTSNICNSTQNGKLSRKSKPQKIEETDEDGESNLPRNDSRNLLAQMVETSMM